MTKEKTVPCPKCQGTGKSPVNTLLSDAGDPCNCCGGSGKVTPDEAKSWRGYRPGHPIYPV